MKDENMLKKKDFDDAAIMRGLGFNFRRVERSLLQPAGAGAGR